MTTIEYVNLFGNFDAHNAFVCMSLEVQNVNNAFNCECVMSNTGIWIAESRVLTYNQNNC